jgi:hypothetical protein
MSCTIATNYLPVFDGSNYSLWKIRIRVYLKSIDVWNIVKYGWTHPGKPMAEWTKDEKNACIKNDKAINSIFMSLSTGEFNRISRCKIAKEAWDTLKITHERIKTVKSSKLQMLIFKFEEIRMEEDETFEDFYTKLNVIRNSTINLGKKVSDIKMVRKIMRSLPKRFVPKVIAIEESKDLDTMKVEELVGCLQAFEHTLPRSKKNKTIALKVVKKDSNVS